MTLPASTAATAASSEGPHVAGSKQGRITRTSVSDAPSLACAVRRAVPQAPMRRAMSMRSRPVRSLSVVTPSQYTDDSAKARSFSPWRSPCSTTSTPPMRSRRTASSMMSLRHREPVSSQPVEGLRRVVEVNLGVYGTRASGDVRRIRHDHVRTCVEVAQTIARVGEHRAHAFADLDGLRAHVAAQIHPRVLARLNEGYQGIWHLVRDRKANGTGAGTQVRHPHGLAALGAASTRAASIATCATVSVSGRGTKTPGPTSSSRVRK